jgi:hypothetical protein
MYALLSAVGLVSLAWNVVAIPLHPLLSEETGLALGRSVIAYSLPAVLDGGIGHRNDARRFACLDQLKDERGLIIAANHPSMLDALLLVARLPRSACIMKASLMRNRSWAPARGSRATSATTPRAP